MSAVLQRAQRSEPLATYAGSCISRVGTPVQRKPHSAARDRQSSSSAAASEGDRAVAHSTDVRPRLSWATRATNAESAPPLKATTTRPSRRSERRSAASEAGAAGAAGVGVATVIPR